MALHNYGINDFDIYSRDPEWQSLHRAAFPEHYKRLEEQNHVVIGTLGQLSDEEMIVEINKAFNVEIDKNQNDTDTQRFFNAIGWTERKPEVLNEYDFETKRKKLKASTIYHCDAPFTLEDSDEKIDAEKFVKQFFATDNAPNRQYLSAGLYGDGTYFSTDSVAIWADYAENEMQATQFKAFLNSNAKIIEDQILNEIVLNYKHTHPESYRLLEYCKQGTGKGKTDGMRSIIAAINGYNVIKSKRGNSFKSEVYYTVLDRSAITACDKFIRHIDAVNGDIKNW